MKVVLSYCKHIFLSWNNITHITSAHIITEFITMLMGGLALRSSIQRVLSCSPVFAHWYGGTWMWWTILCGWKQEFWGVLFWGDVFRSFSLCHAPISHSFPSLIIFSPLHLGIWKGQRFPNTRKQAFPEIGEPEILIPFCELCRRTEQRRPALPSGRSTGLTAAVLRGLRGSV